jgi:hypothetical protein
VARKENDAKEVEKGGKEGAVRLKLIADATELKLKHARDNKPSVSYIQGKAKTCPNIKFGAPIQYNGSYDQNDF